MESGRQGVRETAMLSTLTPLSLYVYVCSDNDDGGGDDCNDGLALAQNVEIVFLSTLRYYCV